MAHDVEQILHGEVVRVGEHVRPVVLDLDDALEAE